jgi:chromosome segregation ATPase
MSNPEITVTAAAVAEARGKLADAQGRHDEAMANKDQVAQRLAELEGKRASIRSARKAGDRDPAAGPRLALLDVDIEVLREILADRQAKLRETATAVGAANAAAAGAEQQLQIVTDAAAVGRLVERLRELESLMARTIEAIDAKVRPGTRYPWAPTPALADRLRKLDLVRIDGARGAFPV